MNVVPDIVKQLRSEEQNGKFGEVNIEENDNQVSKNESESSILQIFKASSEENERNYNLENIKNKYLTIFENYAVAITIADENERIISWNKYAEKLLNLDEKELSNKHVSSLYPEEEWMKIRSEDIRKKGMKYKLETKMKRKGHPNFDVELSLSVLRGKGGKITGSVAIIKDITELKNTEKELIESEEKYRTIFENSAVAIMLTDKNERIIQWNEYTEKMLGKGKNELYMKPVKSLYPPEEWKKIRSEKIREKGMQHHLETKAYKKDGKLLDVDVSLSVLKDLDGKITGSIGVIKDISDTKKSEKKYHNLFETAIDPIILLDEKGIFTEVNKQVTEILGYKKEELLGKKFKDVGILDEKSTNLAIENFNKRIDGKKVPPYEVNIITKNGDKIPAEINADVLFDNNRIYGDLVILRDLRDRYKREHIENELVESEKKFRNIFDSASDILIYIDSNLKIVDVNKTTSEFLNLKKEKIIGKNFKVLEKYFSKNQINNIIRQLKTSLNGEKVTEYQSEMNIKDIYYKFLFSNDIIKENVNVKGVLLRGRDITKRQQAWDELVRLEEKYRVLAETSADGVITVDPLGRLTYINPSFEKICGRRKSQILATLFRDYLSDDSIYLFQQIFIDAQKKKDKIEGVDLEIVHSSGNIVPIEVNISSLKKQNEFQGIMCTVRDITERKKVEEELKKSERLKTEFMNIAAHELKSPVTPIKGYLDLIISDKDSPKKIKDWAKISLRNSNRLLSLVNDILDVSRLDTDTMRFDISKISPVDILNEIIEDMRPSIEAKKLEFISHVPKDLPDIMGDRYRLSQVLKNLLVNAIKFTDNGSIAILAKKEGKYIYISVVDSGIGISKDELPKIFSKFYQAYTGDDRKNEGTGLGLFICKEIIKKHNGDIWANSEIRKGSTFTIKIPHL